MKIWNGVDIKIMINIKNKIKEWLFKDELLEINKLNEKHNILQNDFLDAKNRLKEAQYAYREAYKLSEDAQKLVNSIVDVGTDIGFRSDDHSWAVICIQGKTDYVKFMPLQHKDARDVAEFLKNFKYSNRCTDSPFGYKEMINDYIYKW